MRRLTVLVLGFLLFLPLGASAGEPNDTRAKALDVLKVRLEAKQREAELLEKTGRTEEALAAFQEIGKIYDREVERIARLFPGADPIPPRPVVRERPAPIQPRRLWPERTRPAPDPSAASLEAALDRAVAWLVSHQSPNGGWEAANFGVWCDGKPALEASKRPDGEGKALYDVGVTGLALDALMSAGVNPGDDSAKGKALARGLRYLANVQDPEGCFGPRATQQYIYSHGAASIAMVRAYGLSGNLGWKNAAQKALDFIALARNPYFAWRYGIKPGDNDTSITTWMIAALQRARQINAREGKLGKAAPLVIDEAAFEGAKSWLDKVTDPDYGKVGYLTRGSGSARPQELLDRFPAERVEGMTSAGLLVRHWIGERQETQPVIQKGIALVLRTLPVWNRSSGDIDMYAWLMGTLAMSEVGGKPWALWRNAICQALLPSQGKGTPCESGGSWSPLGPWGPDGGRVYSTALCAIMLATAKNGL